MKDIHIELADGLWDGEHLYGNSYDVDEARLAKKCYWATRPARSASTSPDSRPRRCTSFARVAHTDVSRELVAHFSGSGLRDVATLATGADE